MGASGICIEDATCPKRCSFYGMSEQLEEPAVMAGKLRAALEKRTSDDFVVIARTEALVQGHGMHVALERARMYNDAGCDGFLIHSKAPKADEVLSFADAYHAAGLSAPLVCVPTSYPEVTSRQLEDAGFRLVIYANFSVRAAVKVLEAVFARIKTYGSLAPASEMVVDMERIFELIFVSELKENVQRYGGNAVPTSAR
jgi:phosphoenolpyruvate phosphomutase